MAIMSRTSQYALYALHCFHDRPDGAYIRARTISLNESIPSNYLSKVLRELVRAGILASVRGPNGGFRLTRPLSEVKLMQVRELFEGPWGDRACVLGMGRCDPDRPCAAHEQWQPVAESMARYLQATSVADIVGKSPLPAAGEDMRLFGDMSDP